MFQRILVPLDGSPCAEWAVPVAGRIARASGGSVILLQVLTAPFELACYGVVFQQGTPDAPDRSQAWLRFVTGRPVSALTTQFLQWCCERLLKEGKTNWLLIWDNGLLA